MSRLIEFALHPEAAFADAIAASGCRVNVCYQKNATRSNSMRAHGQKVCMAGIAITQWELTAGELQAAGKTKDARAARRMLAIALMLEGVDRATAAATFGMDR